jgi:hypothetical protein
MADTKNETNRRNCAPVRQQPLRGPYATATVTRREDPHGHRLDLVMGNVNHRATELSVKLRDLRAHLHTHLGVQVGQRFVEEEHLRTAHNGATQSYALALAAGESAWFALQHVIKAKGLRGPSDGFRNEILLLLCQLQAERHVVEQGHVRLERIVLEHHRYPVDCISSVSRSSGSFEP